MIDGYESPIEMAVKKTVNDIIEDRENAIIAKISEEMSLNINKEELLKALKYDRDQYHKGYINGEIAGYKQGYEDALTYAKSRIEELLLPNKEVKNENDAEIQD